MCDNIDLITLVHITVRRGSSMKNFDEEPVEVVTPYSYQESKAFLSFHSRMTAYFGYAIIVAYMSFVAYEIYFTGSYDNYLWGILIIGAALLNILISKGLYFTQKAYERSHQNIAKGFRYLFKNDEVVLINLLTAEDEEVRRVSDCGRVLKQPPAPPDPDKMIPRSWDAAQQQTPVLMLPRGWNVLPYANIMRVDEAKSAFYIYVNRNVAFIVSKDGFVTGKTYDFESLMESKLGKRFRQQKKNRN